MEGPGSAFLKAYGVGTSSGRHWMHPTLFLWLSQILSPEPGLATFGLGQAGLDFLGLQLGMAVGVR